MDNVNRCVCCGEIIPEGRQVCVPCERDTNLYKKCKWIKVEDSDDHCKDCASKGCPKKMLRVISKEDPITPTYYNDSKISPWDVIEDWKLGFNLGSAMKYIKRAGKKAGNSKIQDLKKIRAYIDREIENTEKEGTL